MEAVKVQDIAANDLPWQIEYHADRCTMCGSCVASCTFRAIKVEVQRKSVTVSERVIYSNNAIFVVIDNDLEVTRWKQ